MGSAKTNIILIFCLSNLSICRIQHATTYFQEILVKLALEKLRRFVNVVGEKKIKNILGQDIILCTLL